MRRTSGEKSGASDLYYPASNRLAADVALNAGTRRWRSLDREIVRIVQQSLKAKSASDAGLLERRRRDRTATSTRRWPGGSSRPRASNWTRPIEDLHKRVTATRMWASVYDTACLVLPNYASRATGKEKSGGQRAARATADVRASAETEQ